MSNYDKGIMLMAGLDSNSRVEQVLLRLQAFKHFRDLHPEESYTSPEAEDALLLADEIERLRARLAEEERDAKRYRWLRTNREEGFWKCHEKDLEGGQVLKYGTDLDATIDAARATDSATQRETAP